MLVMASGLCVLSVLFLSFAWVWGRAEFFGGGVYVVGVYVVRRLGHGVCLHSPSKLTYLLVLGRLVGLVNLANCPVFVQ